MGKWGLDRELDLNRELPIASFKMPSGNAWVIIYFFTQIAQMQEQERLHLDDINVAYGDYIDLLWFLFKQYLTADHYQNKFQILGDLCQKIDEAPYEREFKPLRSGPWSVSTPYARKIFWEREAALCPQNGSV